MHELYSPEELAAMERAVKRAIIAALSIAAAALLGCVLLCSLVGRWETAALLKATVGLSTLGGWICIYLYNFPIRERQHELTHARMLREGERETLEGVPELDRQRMRIRGSIRFYPLTLTDTAHTRRSKVIAAKSRQLRALSGKRVRLYTVNGYVAAWEELSDAKEHPFPVV